MKPRPMVSEAFNIPCPVCGAEAGRGCIDEDNGTEQPMTSMHAGRAFNTSGPIVVRHTGEFDADGGAILEEVVPTEEAR